MVLSREARASSLPDHGDTESHSAASAADSSAAVVVLQDLVKFFGRFAALRGVSASFAPGKLYVIVGDNGAGKSTLLRVIAGLMQPSQGSVTLLGAKSAREVAHRIGYMGHAPLLYDELEGMENLRYFAGLYGLHDDAVCWDAMRRVGLDPVLERRVGQYSQGMRQRLSLARAVLHDPELILLDEPFSNVDMHSARDMAVILGTVRDQGKTIFVVTHQSALMGQVADELVHMAAGKIESRELVRPVPVASNTAGGDR
jgi:heme ABC exporter ATP-binding subunit CcmA